MLQTVRYILLGGKGYIGPGDLLGGALFWAGLRAYNRAYARNLGPLIDVVKTSDGTQSTTIYAKPNGTINYEAMAALGFGVSVSKLYDQTGNGHHFVQATLANMPTITFNGLGMRPTMVFNGTSMQFGDIGTTPMGVAPFTWAGVGNSDAQQGRFMRSAGTNTPGMSRSANANEWSTFSNSGLVVATASDGSFHSWVGVFNGASSVLRVDTTEGTGSITADPGTAALAVGWNTINTWWKGKIQEFGGWAGQAIGSVRRTQLTDNAKSYWGF